MENNLLNFSHHDKVLINLIDFEDQMLKENETILIENQACYHCYFRGWYWFFKTWFLVIESLVFQKSPIA